MCREDGRERHNAAVQYILEVHAEDSGVGRRNDVIVAPVVGAVPLLLLLLLASRR